MVLLLLLIVMEQYTLPLMELNGFHVLMYILKPPIPCQAQIMGCMALHMEQLVETELG